jgi:DNA gyrase subunit A
MPKTQPLEVIIKRRRRGGMGKSATAVKDEDFVEHLLIASTHATIHVVFQQSGQSVLAEGVPDSSWQRRGSRGRPMVNLLPLEEGERVTSILPVDEYTEGHFIFMATANGTVKKTALMDFARQRSVGLRALHLEEGDVLVGTAVTRGDGDVMLFSSEGKTVRFKEADVRAMGRTARGVRGIRLGQGHKMISLIIPQAEGWVLTVSENGYGKRTASEDFPTKGRGGKGLIAMSTSARNGRMVGAVQVFEGDELMLISNQGTLVRTRADEVSIVGRNTQGVRVIRLKEDEHLVSIERIAEPDEGETEEAAE